ncbi:MAG: hypothetical protein IJL14_03095 [Selenomonadaceae bacterium]|nr:hypothetical protein [Selenomonadaceae bacterium]
MKSAARALKKARDENWIDTETINGESVKVQRTDAIRLIGGSQVNNEECYQLTKIFRALGAMSLDNQTRVCHANTPPAMSVAFGRGAMTNPWYDLKNTKLAWIEGSNIAECHPPITLMLINPAFNFDDGIFSGYNEKTCKYDMTSWQYQLDANGKPMRSADLFAPNTVMSILKKHYSRYSFEVVSSITGASVADIKMAAS